MPVRRLVDGPDARREAGRLLRAGGLVALPTDTVYGIAVALDTPGGIERLFAAKGRPPDKAIALLLADDAQAEQIGEPSDAARVLAGAFWPGGLTLVLRRRADRPLPAALTGGALAPGAIPTIGVRVPDHETPRAIARELGPLPTTSANRSGEPELGDAAAIEQALGSTLDLIIDGGPATGGPASTVVDTTMDEPRILRAGAIPEHVIRACLEAAGLPPLPSGVGR